MKNVFSLKIQDRHILSINIHSIVFIFTELGSSSIDMQPNVPYRYRGRPDIHYYADHENYLVPLHLPSSPVDYQLKKDGLNYIGILVNNDVRPMFDRNRKNVIARIFDIGTLIPMNELIANRWYFMFPFKESLQLYNNAVSSVSPRLRKHQ